MRFKLILLMAILTACSSTKELQKNSINEIILVNSSMVDCMGVGPMKCYQVKFLDKNGNEQSSWQNMYTRINGFDYMPGYIYKLKVKKEALNPKDIPQDSSSIRYTLISIISKTKNTDEYTETKSVK